MSKSKNSLSIIIDNKPYQVTRGITILKAAEQNDIYIPTLCAHEELSPHGGCRMCIVEVEGFRNFPTACTTPVSEGMIIRTKTAQIQSMRMEILQLFMSEHTSSCLVCDENEDCKRYSGTIRKAGITTGCRYCPNDNQCEIQDVAEYLGVKDIVYPIYYRNLRVEKEDPFYDRDYNLCILCGRCVRMCQEIRTANVLAYKNSGRETIVGPAFGRTHMDSGCEFCGACVSVCPTGTLSEKARKWEGKPDREVVTTCTFCGVGCQMQLLIKGDKVIGSLPVVNDKINDGQLCVRGRFCVNEMVNNYQRLIRPFKIYNDIKVEVLWDEAVEMATEQLNNCSPDNFGMVVSPNCSNESLYVAQKFSRVAMKSHNVDTNARTYYGAGFNQYLNLMKKSVSLDEVRKAELVLCIGLDTRFDRSVIGVELRKAVARGAKIITVNPREHNLTLIAEKWLQPQIGTEAEILDMLVTMTSKGKTSPVLKKKSVSDADLVEVAGLLNNSKSSVIMIGSEFLQYHNSNQILETIEKLAKNTKAGVMPLPAQNNLHGTIMMGTYPEFLPGGSSSSNKSKLTNINKIWKTKLSGNNTKWSVTSLNDKSKLKVLYLIGEVPYDKRPSADFIIFQNIYPADTCGHTDLMLPSTAFTEEDGTFINGEGRLQKINKAVNPPADSLPDWKILCMIAKKMGYEGFDYKSVKDIQKEIAAIVPDFKDYNKPSRNPNPIKCDGKFTISENGVSHTSKKSTKYPFLLTTSVVEHSYRGFPLSRYVSGAKVIFPEGVIEINSIDAGKAKINTGDDIIVESKTLQRNWKAKIVAEQPQGTVHVRLWYGEAIGQNPHAVSIRKKNV
ncbi:MAG: hypothetical protein BA863_18265 [Desulfovibrio sp. S3730MH75]|nr:MAG: hypothetical protein BA863_18265 [Desulfovibrio sp. S3730MH75]